MDRKPKARPVARTKTVRDDPAQSARFIETARLVDADETGKEFEARMPNLRRPLNKSPKK